MKRIVVTVVAALMAAVCAGVASAKPAPTTAPTVGTHAITSSTGGVVQVGSTCNAKGTICTNSMSDPGGGGGGCYETWPNGSDTGATGGVGWSGYTSWCVDGGGNVYSDSGLNVQPWQDGAWNVDNIGSYPVGADCGGGRAWRVIITYSVNFPVFGRIGGGTDTWTFGVCQGFSYVYG